MQRFSSRTVSPRFYAGLLTLLLLVSGVAMTTATAQLAGTGAISGTVTDSTGAVVPGATVTATATATNVKTVRQTTGSGDYNITPLAPGLYTVTVTAAGFEQLVQQNVNVNALQTVALSPHLTVGQTNETVTVSTAPAQLQTTDATLGGVMENDMYAALPLQMSQGGSGTPDQRRATDFEYLMPGVQANYTSNNSTDNSGIVNGSGSGGGVSEIYIDGVAFTAGFQQGDPRFTWTAIGVDAVNQFQVQTAGYSAQYQGQGVENYSIKQGGNKIHGSIYEYFRNTALDAWQFTSKVPTLNAAGVLVPGGIKARENQNEYGIVLSGPIIKNKLFLFYNYGQYREAHGPTVKQQNMPTTAMLNGDFSGWATATGYSIYDPSTQTCTAGNKSCTRLPFMGIKNGLPTPNVIPASHLSAASTYYNKLYVPYESVTNQNAYSNNIATGYSSGLNNWYQTGRLDYNASSKNQIGIIVAFGRQASTGPNSVGAANQLGPPFNTGQAYSPQTTVDIVEDTYTINSHMVNQFRYGFGRYRSASVSPNRTPEFAADTAGLTGLPAGQASDGFPGISFSTSTACPAAGPGINNLCTEGGYAWNTKVNNTYTLVDNFQWELGRNNITIGAQMEWLQYNYLQVATDSGPMNYTFSNAETSIFQPGTTTTLGTQGSSFASYDIGAVDSANVKALIPELGMRYRDPSFYVEDDYKATSKLTFNIGLRWDIYPALREAHNLYTFLNPTGVNPITGNLGTLEFAGNGNSSTYCNCSSPVPTWYKNFGPRLGLAYSLNDKTVIRASYDVAFTHGNEVGGTSTTGPSQVGITPSATAPGGILGAPSFYWDNSTCAAGLANGVACGFTGAITTPPISNTYVTGNTAALGKASTSVAYYDPYYGSRAPEYLNWAVGFQRQVTNDIAATVTYVGSQGHFEPAASGAKPRGFWSSQVPQNFAALGTVYATGTTNPLLTAPSSAANIAQAVSLGFTPPNGFGGSSSPFFGTNSVYQYFYQFPQYSSITDYSSNVINSNFHAIEISIKQREAHGLTFMLNYTYSKTIDDGGTFRVGYNPRLDRSLSTTDQPQNLTSTVVYKLPFGHGKIGGDNYWANALGGGWSLSGIFIYHSGVPLPVIGAGCGGGGILQQCMPSLNPNFTGSARINGGYNVHHTAATYSQTPYVNAAAFTVANLAPTPTANNSGPAFYQPGNITRVGVMNLWSQGLYNLDLGIKRTFKIYENVNLQFEADLLNATNHVVFGTPAATVTAASGVNGPGVGTNTGNTFGTVSSVANNARDAQLSARINF